MNDERALTRAFCRRKPRSTRVLRARPRSRTDRHPDRAALLGQEPRRQGLIDRLACKDAVRRKSETEARSRSFPVSRRPAALRGLVTAGGGGPPTPPQARLDLARPRTGVEEVDPPG